MAEGTSLENWFGGNSNVGSNPTLSVHSPCLILSNTSLASSIARSGCSSPYVAI